MALFAILVKQLHLVKRYNHEDFSRGTNKGM